LNQGPGDVYLVRGEAYLDPNLSGNWQLVHSESTGNFHLNYLQSAIWTLNLAMPSNILAVNATGGVHRLISNYTSCTQILKDNRKLRLRNLF